MFPACGAGNTLKYREHKKNIQSIHSLCMTLILLMRQKVNVLEPVEARSYRQTGG